MVFKRCLKIAPRLSGSPMGVPLVPATELRAEELLLATEIAKSLFGFFFDFDKEGFVLHD